MEVDDKNGKYYLTQRYLHLGRTLKFRSQEKNLDLWNDEMLVSQEIIPSQGSVVTLKLASHRIKELRVDPSLVKLFLDSKGSFSTSFFHDHSPIEIFSFWLFSPNFPPP